MAQKQREGSKFELLVKRGFLVFAPSSQSVSGSFCEPSEMDMEMEMEMREGKRLIVALVLSVSWVVVALELDEEFWRDITTKNKI